jgi:microcystin-dependent protein
MTTAFLGQIELFAFGYVPRGWAACQGQLLPVNQNQALYALLGTTYGGDGTRTFALPDLRGRVPIGMDGNFPIGQRGGQEAHALSAAEMPQHGHNLMADATTTQTGNQPSPAVVLGQSSGQVTPGGPAFSANLYASGNPNAQLNGGAMASVGNGQAHENRMPSLVLNFCICIDPHASMFPSR